MAPQVLELLVPRRSISCRICPALIEPWPSLRPVRSMREKISPGRVLREGQRVEQLFLPLNKLQIVGSH